ncbi:hypothetical protein HFD88_009048 [Aspergillus terreus]|nr:hypothetical protein HFD88_009048 [Aspergillus terreus]
MFMVPRLHLVLAVSAAFMGRIHALPPLQQYLQPFRVLGKPKTDCMLPPAPVPVGSPMTLSDGPTISCTCNLANSTHVNRAMQMLMKICIDAIHVDKAIGTIFESGATILSAPLSGGGACNQSIVVDSYNQVQEECKDKQGAIAYADGLVFSVRNSWEPRDIASPAGQDSGPPDDTSSSLDADNVSDVILTPDSDGTRCQFSHAILDGKANSPHESTESFELIRPASSVHSLDTDPGATATESKAPGNRVISNWTLYASLKSLYVGHLLNFFKDAETRDAASDTLQGIGIKDFSIKYAYQGKSASTLAINATISLEDKVELGLDFSMTPERWDFFALLRDNHPTVKTSVGNIIRAIGGSDIELPEFAAGLTISVDKQDQIGLLMDHEKTGGRAQKGVLILMVWFQVSGFAFQFIKIRDVVPVGTKPPPPVKRILVMGVSKFPSVKVDLLGDLSAPLDEVLFMLVRPKMEPGLTSAELANINSLVQTWKQKRPELPITLKPLLYKQVKKTYQAQDIVINSGLHFMIILKDSGSSPQVAVDYVFNLKKKSATLPSMYTQTNAQEEQAVEDQGAAMTAYKKDVGVFSMENLGFKFSTGPNGKGMFLILKLDASVTIGPLAFVLLGLGLSVDLSKASLRKFSADAIKPLLEGMGAEFNRPPLQVAGELQYRNDSTGVSYAGGVSLGFVPWLFQAAGYYGELVPKTGLSFRTAFLYFSLQGPLITLELATIEGVCGGFGYNCNLTLPTAPSVPEYPLLNSPGKDPKSALKNMLSSQWFQPQPGSFWVAAGLTVKAFEMLAVQALLVVEWNPTIKLALAALATADIPGGGSGMSSFARVQLGMTALIDLVAGTVRIDGQLTPASYVLDPNCHLTGGFAFHSWFKDTQTTPNLKGDWVFTIGGLHPAFDAPAQYPNPPRLSISWQFSKSISITGAAYFAITPKVCMGGGRLDVTLTLPPLYAYFDAFVDFLINYRPFHFIAEGGLSIGVQFTLDLWLVTIPINIHIAAELYITGPPISGKVYVDFWVFGFRIDFGKDSPAPEPVLLDGFIDLVCQSSSASSHSNSVPMPLPSSALVDIPTEAATEPDRPTLSKAHVFAVQGGLVPQDKAESKPSSDPWIVRAATFSFSINCKFAIDTANIITMDQGKEKKRNTVSWTKNKIYAKPMQTRDNEPLTSTLDVRISPPPTTVLDQQQDVPFWKNNRSIEKDVPLGLWGPYDPTHDPSRSTNPPDLLNGTTDRTAQLMMGVVVSHPDPLPSSDRTVPMNTEDSQIADVQGRFPLPAMPSPEGNFEGVPASGKEQWGRVQYRWQNPLLGPTAGMEAVSFWTCLGEAKMGWNEAKVKGSEKLGMRGDYSRRLVSGINEFYPYIAMLSKA